jgi:hypothetical protein
VGVNRIGVAARVDELSGVTVIIQGEGEPHEASNTKTKPATTNRKILVTFLFIPDTPA